MRINNKSISVTIYDMSMTNIYGTVLPKKTLFGLTDLSVTPTTLNEVGN